MHLSSIGLVEAVLPAAFACGLVYAVWYTALPSLSATRTTIVRLAVPILVALAGLVLLGENAGIRLIGCAALTLGRVALATCHPIYLNWRRKT